MQNIYILIEVYNFSVQLNNAITHEGGGKGNYNMTQSDMCLQGNDSLQKPKCKDR